MEEFQLSLRFEGPSLGRHQFWCLPDTSPFFFQSKTRNNNVTPHQAGDLHFYKLHEYHEGGQGEIFSAVKHIPNLNFYDNYRKTV